MENGDKIPWSFQSWTSFVLFLILTWGIALVPPSLVSKRPAGELARSPEQSRDHRYESRLWQDPFEVLPAFQKEESNAECAPLTCLKAARLSAAGNEETLILAVFLRGEPYPEDVENRLRSRYAVISALVSAGYTPDDGGDLRCLSLDSVTSRGLPFERFTHHGRDRNKPYREKLNALVAREWSDSKRSLPEKVVVVWVDERLFDETNVHSHPIVDLSRLAQEIRKSVLNAHLAMIGPQSFDSPWDPLFDLLKMPSLFVEEVCKAAPKVHLAMIGPQTSDTLRAMLSDKGDSSTVRCAHSDVDRTRIYSFSSTDDALRETQDQTPFFQRHFKLIPVIGTDRQLAGALREELKRRGVDPAKDPAKIALVAEWDTSFGRSMIEVFSREFEGDWYDLRLMYSVDDVSGIPTAGQSLIIVAAVKNVLHFRIFNRDGQRVVDTDETKLTTQARPIEALRKQLESLWPSYELTESERTWVIAAVTSIVGHTLFEGNRTARCSTAEPDSAAKVRCFAYLRGIDGRLPKGPAAESKEADKAGGQAKGVLLGGEALVLPPEVQAFGRSQVDYIPRLVAQMKAQAGTREWKAIGVLGSDFYDKIMLIEVLRHDFPEALIFTTDMDARYLDTDKHRITRNLLVGSHYGLELNEKLQGAIPPFRSAYQTSLFFGCLKALYDYPEEWQREKAGSSASALSIEWKCPKDNDTPNPQPLVFEIGRTRAHPLTNPIPENLHPETYRRSLKLTSRQWVSLVILTVLGGALGLVLLPVLTRRHFQVAAVLASLSLWLLTIGFCIEGRWAGLFAFLSIALFCSDLMKQRLGIATMFAALLSLDVAAGQVGEWWVGLFALPMFALACTVTSSLLPKWKRHPLVLFAAVFIPIVTLAAFDHCWSQGEPFSVLEGVSNWPTILLRVTAAAYCVFALIRGNQADKESVRKLTKRYNLKLTERYNLEKAWPLANWRDLHAHAWRTLLLLKNRPTRALCWVLAWLNPKISLAGNDPEDKKVKPINLWKSYYKLSRVGRVTGRVLGYFILYFVFCCALIGLFGLPNNPYRGPLNMVVNFVVLYMAISLTVGLLLTVFDATRLCNRLMRVLMENETDWSDQVLLKEAAANLGVDPQLLHFKVYSDCEPVDCEPVKISLEQYADLKLVSERTEVVRRRVYDAAIPSLLMFLARSPFFDQYHMSWSMILIFAVAFAVVFACGYCLRRSAREARRKGQEKIAEALEKVRESLYDMRSACGRGSIGDGGMPDFEGPIVELSAFCMEGTATELVHATRWPHVVANPPQTDRRRRTVREEAVRALERIDQGLDQITTGAFSKLKDDPFLHTLIVIVGGYGALQSLEIILRTTL